MEECILFVIFSRYCTKNYWMYKSVAANVKCVLKCCPPGYCL